ncbi:MAG: hypothetical protein ACI4A8_02075, partial [Muribaculaceae bacterium]
MNKKQRFGLAICLALLSAPVHAQNDNTNDAKEEPELTLEEVVVTANAVERVKKTAYNVVAISTDKMRNSTKTLSDVLA